MTKQGSKAPAILRRKSVEERTGLSRSTIYQRICQGKFPRQVGLGGQRIVGWVESEIDRWIEERIEESKQTVSAPTDVPATNNRGSDTKALPQSYIDCFSEPVLLTGYDQSTILSHLRDCPDCQEYLTKGACPAFLNVLLPMLGCNLAKD
ncbi:helix-turn-helix transcriptional regulator [Noviherbaspirillum galbum]|uniref:AlpA family transcriptional regulator n=1 Tax=Noviherbaspirillum galbum TaxID=2709383 RepID=A0A6B3SSZ5_9BURK|nr:AlpA family transcriptional regulator [Noviherbaspirillum galbum]NEX62465.1 AlpA family transcriptional regulator [Noviherbaspirillum galbum]